MSLEITLAEPRDFRPIDRYVRAHALGTPFHETRWLDLSRLTFGFATQTPIARRDGEIAGVLPLAMVTAPFTGKRLVSVPFGVYGGILADDEEVRAALDDVSHELARRTGARYVEYRNRVAGQGTHVGLDLYETYRRELPADPGEVLATIPRKRRAEVRQGRERHGLVLVEGRDLFDDFYRLYVENKRLLGSPVFAPSYFRTLLDLFDARASLHGLRRDGEVVAAVLSVYDDRAIYPYYSGEDARTRTLGTMNTLYASLMEDAVRRGVGLFDFGRSRQGSGAAAFKRHMGFEPAPLHYQFYFLHGGSLPTLNPSNPRTALPRKILAKIPSWLARLVGPAIMRQVP